jgi:hypothetical protein
MTPQKADGKGCWRCGMPIDGLGLCGCDYYEERDKP